jgi:hypothetical protein
MSIEQKLRDAVQKLRRTPMPIADLAPLLLSAADELEINKKLIADLQKEADERNS